MSIQLQVGVKALIQDDEGKILLLERNSELFGHDDRWDIPGGRIQTGEPHLEGLKREIKEETGMSLAKVKDIFYVQDILRNEESHVVRITYLVEATGEVELSHEHTSHKWVDVKNIENELSSELIDRFLVDAMSERGWI